VFDSCVFSVSAVEAQVVRKNANSLARLYVGYDIRDAYWLEAEADFSQAHFGWKILQRQ
jgi:hypothetical protein